MKKLSEFISPGEKLINPSDESIRYSGRIDTQKENVPQLIYPCSSIYMRFTGTGIKLVLENHRGCWDNYLGFLLDGEQEKVKLAESGMDCITLAEGLEDTEHEILVFKRMDSCHTIDFYGFLVPEDTRLLPLPEPVSRRIEVYGDSVSAGEISEAVDYCGIEDPKHNGEYSNSYYSYAWMTARKLGADIHDIAQGGIALMNGSGYFMPPEYRGMENTYHLLHYNQEIGPDTVWNFDLYTPQVVIVAIGQNDNHPDEYMGEDYDGEKAKCWRSHYKEFVQNLRKRYPKALILLSTTILSHHPNWDIAIDQVCKELGDEKVKHFLYSNNGSGTRGHIRIPEADKMSDELAHYIRSFGEEIWNS